MQVMDAVRISDGLKVVIKRIKTSTDESHIATYLHSLKHPNNHTVPILEVISLPETTEVTLLVMSRLLPFHRLPFRRLGEFAEATEQFLIVRRLHDRLRRMLNHLQGLEFMHRHKVAHRCGLLRSQPIKLYCI
jgi:hypothetical protein